MRFFERVFGWFFRLFFLPNKKESKEFLDNFISKMRFIVLIDNGFEIMNVEKIVLKTIYWQDIRNIVFDENLLLKFYFKNNEIFEIPESFHQNWFLLLRNIPDGYTDFDKNAVDSFFKNLNGCEVCGLQSVYNQECMNCGAEVWNTNLEESYKSKSDYLKDLQLDYFFDESIENVNISNSPEFGFDTFKNWSALISKDDFK